MTDTPSIADATLAADPEDRPFAPADPIWRAANRRFVPVLVGCLLFHATVIAILVANDRSADKANLRQTEIPVEVVVAPPPPPPPLPPPPQKKPQQPKPPPPKQEVQRDETPAYDAPRTQNNETLERQITANQTQAQVKAKPTLANATKPTPAEPPNPAQNAAPEPAKETTAAETPKDEPDAEALDKAAPIKAAKSQQRMKPAKQRAPLPDDQKSTVARELAALEPSPLFSVAAEAKPAPVSGGTERTRYVSILFGLIMRQQHFPATPHVRHDTALSVVAFWIDERGKLVEEALYRTSGYPELDREAMAAVRRAAPFPPPPPNEAHGFIAQMSFPPK